VYNGAIRTAKKETSSMVTLTLQADTLSSEALHDLTRDLCRTLNREADVQATMPEGPAGPGAKGAILLTCIQMIHNHGPELLTHSGAVVLGELVLTILRPYFERIPSMKAKLRGDGGSELVLAPESVHPERLQQTVEDVKEILGG
jgi:hypothetical protein